MSSRLVERRGLVEAREIQSDATMIVHGREVIQLARDALGDLLEGVDESFARAVSLLLSLRGRIVVTGMGKSGHIGRKIAATLAATGSPALFVHPAEASHGDLGMLVRGDVLIVLSNSGGTVELGSILAHATAHEIPVIGIASQAGSAVMRQSDVQLLLPEAREACPANIAPTTSTMLMLAIGDALAIAAMRARGVSRDGLQALHPGGSIGHRLKPIASVMHVSNLPLVAPSTPMREVLPTMTAASLGVAGVLDDAGTLMGVITDGDLRRHAEGLMAMVAADVMTAGPVTIVSDALAEDAVALMKHHKITSLFVTGARGGDQGRPVGLVHIHDFLRLGLL